MARRHRRRPSDGPAGDRRAGASRHRHRTPPAMPGGGTRERILDIALDLFIEQGLRQDLPARDRRAARLLQGGRLLPLRQQGRHPAGPPPTACTSSSGTRWTTSASRADAAGVGGRCSTGFIDQMLANRQLFVLHERNRAAFEQLHREDRHDETTTTSRRPSGRSSPTRRAGARPGAAGVRPGGGDGVALAIAGDAFTDVPSDELAGLIRSTIGDILTPVGGAGLRVPTRPDPTPTRLGPPPHPSDGTTRSMRPVCDVVAPPLDPGPVRQQGAGPEGGHVGGQDGVRVGHGEEVPPLHLGPLVGGEPRPGPSPRRWPAMAHPVCCITAMWVTSRKVVASTSDRSTSAVTRPPAFRRILASPGRSPSITNGSIRLSMQATRPKCLPARAGFPEAEVAAYAGWRRAARRTWRQCSRTRTRYPARRVGLGRPDRSGRDPGHRLPVTSRGPRGGARAGGGRRSAARAAQVALDDPDGQVDAGQHAATGQDVTVVHHPGLVPDRRRRWPGRSSRASRLVTDGRPRSRPGRRPAASPRCTPRPPPCRRRGAGRSGGELAGLHQRPDPGGPAGHPAAARDHQQPGGPADGAVDGDGQSVGARTVRTPPGKPTARVAKPALVRTSHGPTASSSSTPSKKRTSTGGVPAGAGGALIAPWSPFGRSDATPGRAEAVGVGGGDLRKMAPCNPWKP